MHLPYRPYATASIAVASTFFNLVVASTSHAFNMGIQDGADAAQGVDHITSLFGVSGIFTTITNVLLFIIGAISVIMIIIGGLRYVVSGGDSSKVTAAKNTILYAIVGLLVALLAYAIINFVLTSFSADGGTGGVDV